MPRIRLWNSHVESRIAFTYDFKVTLFYDDAVNAATTYGQFGNYGLPYESYRLAWIST